MQKNRSSVGGRMKLMEKKKSVLRLKRNFKSLLITSITICGKKNMSEHQYWDLQLPQIVSFWQFVCQKYCHLNQFLQVRCSKDDGSGIRNFITIWFRQLHFFNSLQLHCIIYRLLFLNTLMPVWKVSFLYVFFKAWKNMNVWKS